MRMLRQVVGSLATDGKAAERRLLKGASSAIELETLEGRKLLSIAGVTLRRRRPDRPIKAAGASPRSGSIR